MALHGAWAQDKPLRLILVGDSTVAPGNGYGDALCQRLQSTVHCINRGMNGRSSGSYRAEALWAYVEKLLQEGAAYRMTYVLIQFGHNDQPGKPGRSTDLATEFPANMARYAQQVKALGGTPVLVTPLTRRSFQGADLKNDLRPWALATLAVASAEQVPVLDLNALSFAAVQAMGTLEADTLAETRPGKFDHTHLGDKGAQLFAQIVAQELVRLLPELPLRTSLQGVVALGGPLAGATVSARDANGLTAQTTTDALGHYQLDVSAWLAPIAVTAHEAGNDNCLRNDQPRARCALALRLSLAVGDNTTHINALTDWVASDVALAQGYRGPQQLANAEKILAIPAERYAHALQQFHAGFGPALAEAGVTVTPAYDPVTAFMRADGTGQDALLRVLNHTRSYDNNTGEASATVITDMLWQPVAKPFGPAANPPLQLAAGQAALHHIQQAKLRIFIVSDSTAATYERQRLPRMGWGQVFGDYWKTHSDSSNAVAIVNGARAGRSSRDFFNGGWYGQMLPHMRPGDYVVIAHGHNDQNCNANKPVRGAADVANLCTYPNDAQGQRQYPAGRPELSFAASLERYVLDARARGAIPILMTPTTRYLNADRKPAYTWGDARPVVPQHGTRQDASAGYAFTGNYSQTTRDTAVALQVPLIDLEAKTIAFANQHAADWQDYWLVVKDTARYPWYATQTEGIAAKPDTTHFQEAGARAMADLVAQGLRETPALQALAAWLK